MQYRPSEVPYAEALPLYTINLENFRGIDLTNNALNCQPYRSPDMLNIIPGSDGFPVSRKGYRKVGQFDGRINGIYQFGGDYIVHHGNKLSKWDHTLLKSDMNDDFSRAVYWEGKLYLIDGKTYTCLWTEDTEQGEAIRCGMADPYVPTVQIQMKPNKYEGGKLVQSGGGEAFERVNLLTPLRTNSFVPDGTSREFQVIDRDLDATKLKARILGAGGDWQEMAEDAGFTVDRQTGKVTFTTAPPAPVSGRDTVEITYGKTIPGNLSKVTHCTCSVMFGASSGSGGNGGANTLFLAGNKEEPNLLIYSDVGRMNYFPDTNYIYVGQDSARIMGFTLTGNGSLSVHKERNGVDPTIYYLTGELIEDDQGLTTPLYRLVQGAMGVGVIAKRAFANLGNDAMFLSSTGVYADVPAQSVTNERYAESRSFYINPRLMQEPGLEDACAIEYRGCYYLAVGGHVYVADGVHEKAYIENNQVNQYEYEWYYWDNIPARVWFEGTDLYLGESKYQDDRLHFGAADGAIYRFYGQKLEDDGKPISFYWKSKLFDFDTITNFKYLRAVYLMPNPYDHSRVNVDFIQQGIGETVKQTSVDIFNFANIDFSQFSFDTDPTPRIVPIRRRLKKLKTFQIKVWSDAGQPFGLFKVAIQYKVGAAIKQ